MRIRLQTVILLSIAGLLSIAPVFIGCGSDNGGSKGPEEVAAEYVESGNVEDLEKFMDDAMFGISLFEITNIETELISETDESALVELKCSIGLEDESVRGSRIEMMIELEKHEDEWIVTSVEY